MKELTSEGAGREGLDKWGSKGKMDNEGHKNVFFQVKRLRNQVQSSDRGFFPPKDTHQTTAIAVTPS